jgi:hypothetical protein
MGFHNICSKVDRALVAYIIRNGAGTDADTFPAKRSEGKPTPPLTICWSHTAEPMMEGPFAGLYKVEAFVEVRVSGVIEENESTDDPKKKAIDRTSATFDLFNAGDGQSGDALGQAITEAAHGGDSDLLDFTALSARIIGFNQGFNPRNPKLMGQIWVDAMHLEVFCCPANVS